MKIVLQEKNEQFVFWTSRSQSGVHGVPRRKGEYIFFTIIQPKSNTMT